MRALVFDLDDTLMDTYGQLVMDAHRQACAAMQRAGLDIPLEELMATRLHLLQAQPRHEVNELLAAQYGCSDPEVIRTGFETYFNPEITALEPFPGVPELLAALSRESELFLVTAGFRQTQEKKIQTLGLAGYFREICYVPADRAQGKDEAFVYLQGKYGWDFTEMIIIGDRIHNEIAAGNRLGCHTIWLRHGEFAHLEPEGPHEQPTLIAEHITQLPELLAQLRNIAWPDSA
ncbi:MAG TPA: HAD family hydrolase [Candidatus Obscuribacterales bacterium]